MIVMVLEQILRIRMVISQVYPYMNVELGSLN